MISTELDAVRKARKAVDEMRRIAGDLSMLDGHVIVLSDYEVANLREMFRAMGHAAAVDRNPLMAANTGDWVGQIAGKLPHVEHEPNVEWTELARRARDFR
jgi:hypothetical protein